MVVKITTINLSPDSNQISDFLNYFIASGKLISLSHFLWHFLYSIFQLIHINVPTFWKITLLLPDISHYYNSINSKLNISPDSNKFFVFLKFVINSRSCACTGKFCKKRIHNSTFVRFDEIYCVSGLLYCFWRLICNNIFVKISELIDFSDSPTFVDFWITSLLLDNSFE
jgi:hypothetical protein